MRQGTVEASTCMGSDASLLVQRLDVWLTSTDYLWSSNRFLLDTIKSMYETLRDLSTFAFVTSHLLSVG